METATYPKIKPNMSHNEKVEAGDFFQSQGWVFNELKHKLLGVVGYTAEKDGIELKANTTQALLEAIDKHNNG